MTAFGTVERVHYQERTFVLLFPRRPSSQDHESSRIFETKIRKSEDAGSAAPLPGCGVRRDLANLTRKNPFFARRSRRRAGREKWGTAPHPRQRAGCPLQSRLSRHLMHIELHLEKFGMTHGVCLYSFKVKTDNC